jgi:hypothetical protein
MQPPWMCPPKAIPKGSTFSQAHGAVQTPLQVVEVENDMGTPELIATIHLPRSLCPACMALKIFVADLKRPHYKRPLHGSSVCLPLGMAPGDPLLLGAHLVGVTSDVELSAQDAVRVNFAVVSRHARVLLRTLAGLGVWKLSNVTGFVVSVNSDRPVVA